MTRQEPRRAPSPIPPLVVSVLLLVPVTIFVLAIVLNLGAGDPVGWRGWGLAAISLVLLAIAVATCVLRIAPWRRYLAATTPEQRSSDKAADRSDRVTAKAAQSSPTPDYGDRVDTKPEDGPQE